MSHTNLRKRILIYTNFHVLHDQMIAVADPEFKNNGPKLVDFKSINARITQLTYI